MNCKGIQKAGCLMDLRQLEYFAELYRVRNFTKAAENLKVAQPSVTKAIHRLEAELGVRLVDRSQKPLVPTKAGERFYLRAKNILEELDQAVKEASSLAGSVQKVINLGIAPLSGAKLKQMLKDEYPFGGMLLYNVIELSSSEICRKLLEKKLDLGWIINWRLPEELEFISLEQQEALLLLPKESRLALKREITFDDLKNEPFAMDLESTDSALGQIVLEKCRQAGFTPKGRVTTQQYHPNAQLIIDSIRNGYGLTLVPAHSVEDVTDLPVLSMSPPLTFETGIGYRKNLKQTAEVKTFIDVLTAQYPRYVSEVRQFQQ